MFKIFAFIKVNSFAHSYNKKVKYLIKVMEKSNESVREYQDDRIQTRDSNLYSGRYLMLDIYIIIYPFILFILLKFCLKLQIR